MSKDVVSSIKNTKTDYIRIKSSYAKMKTAESIRQTIYTYGVTGYGKTEIVYCKMKM